MTYNKSYKDKTKNKKYDISIINSITKEDYNEIIKETGEHENEENKFQDFDNIISR